MKPSTVKVAPVSSGARASAMSAPPEPSEDARARDATQDASSLSADLLDAAKHASFVVRSSRDRDTVEYVLTEHLRMSGVYWGLTALDLLGRLGEMDVEPILEWLQRCKHASGGYGGSEGHDAHVLYTLSAVQICALLDRMGPHRFGDVSREAVTGVLAIPGPGGTSLFGASRSTFPHR